MAQISVCCLFSLQLTFLWLRCTFFPTVIVTQRLLLVLVFGLHHFTISVYMCIERFRCVCDWVWLTVISMYHYGRYTHSFTLFLCVSLSLIERTRHWTSRQVLASKQWNATYKNNQKNFAHRHKYMPHFLLAHLVFSC